MQYTVHNLHSRSRTRVVPRCAQLWFEIDRTYLDSANDLVLTKRNVIIIHCLIIMLIHRKSKHVSSWVKVPYKHLLTAED